MRQIVESRLVVSCCFFCANDGAGEGVNDGANEGVNYCELCCELCCAIMVIRYFHRQVRQISFCANLPRVQ